MPDSLPPDGGPDPYDGWDLEGLLSGDNVWLPDGMRPVAATLAALRDAPVRAELDGEAAARASFRQVMLAAGNGAGRAVNGHTLILPADGGPPPHGVTRPRHAHRRPSRRPGWTGRAMAGVAAGAAAVMVVGGIALAGGFSSAGPRPGQPGQSASAANPATHGGSPGGGSGLAGNATKVPSPHPTNTASAPSRSTLCRQYWTFFSHHESQADWAAEKDNLRQLSELAGSMWKINDYCAGYVQWGAVPPPAGAGSSDNQGPSGQQDPGDSQANGQPALPAPANGNAGKGNSGNGNSGNGNGNGKDNGNGKGNGNGNGKGNGNQQ